MVTSLSHQSQNKVQAMPRLVSLFNSNFPTNDSYIYLRGSGGSPWESFLQHSANPIALFKVHVGSMRATSRGYVKLKSSSPYDNPIIQPNYLSTEEDRVELRDSIRLTREIFSQKAFDPFRGKELQPGIQYYKSAYDFLMQHAQPSWQLSTPPPPPRCTINYLRKMYMIVCVHTWKGCVPVSD